MVFSAIRLYVFYRIMLESFDIPWTAAGVAFWGMLESSLAAIIVCLPALNQTLVKWYKRFWYGTGDEPKSGIISTLARGISIFERTNHTQRGQVKFLSYSAGETVVGADYVELGDVNSKAASTTAVAVEDQKNQQHEQHEGRPTFTNITNTSYPDISITVERSFYISEETTSDEEASRNQSTASIAAPGRAQLPGRRPSSPTISYAAREGMVRPARETQANDKK
ncbi:hypothetical protein ABW20_dc0110469 [Dactylellina cionopaga]|nr:hypothetical protein ABW20_dc0110469 [Dactylellina cionopaga]